MCRDSARGVATWLGTALSAPALLAAGVAGAAPWTLEPSVALSTTYQSNPQFYVSEPHSGSGELVTIALPLSWQDGRTLFQLRPTANAGDSSGAAGLGVDNRTVDLAWSRGFDRGNWRLNGGYARLDLFGAEAANLGVVRPVGYSTDAVADLGTTYFATARGQLDLDVSQRRLDYHEPGSSLIDYRYSIAAGNYAYALTERTQLLATASAGLFEPDAPRGASHDLSVQVGASRKFTENLSAQATVGHSTMTPVGGGPSDTGDIYAASVKWTRLRWSLSLGASRSRQPGAYGDLALVTDYSAGWSRGFSERLTLTIAAGLTDSEDRYAGVVLDRRSYRHGEFLLTYFLTPAWRLDLRATAAQASNPATALRPTATEASSAGGSIGLVRVFGPTRLF